MQTITIIIATVCYATCRYFAWDVLLGSSFDDQDTAGREAGEQPGSSFEGCVRARRDLVRIVTGASPLSVLVSTSLGRLCGDLKGLRLPELSSPNRQLGIPHWKLEASAFSTDPGTQAPRAGNPP